jgi:hypothetical protein
LYPSGCPGAIAWLEAISSTNLFPASLQNLRTLELELARFSHAESAYLPNLSESSTHEVNFFAFGLLRAPTFIYPAKCMGGDNDGAIP